ncbi:MAG: hypothetical protein A3D28_02100 [Omnitrophica bacterium RIFCSPHIGHO2_02_FULL_63_14]|nr:MAG: hypothetical protein A3D28_02100 [Omnitrophica bacterium RIFCSPHIGHO2_02_FULL_63_14]
MTTDFFESESFLLPSQAKQDVANRLKDTRSIHGLELHVHGEGLKNAKEFADMLQTLKRRGVKITHEFNIKLEFPGGLGRDKTLEIVESMPRPLNGFVKVRVQLGEVP